jgi:hypothetical protein
MIDDGRLESRRAALMASQAGCMYKSPYMIPMIGKWTVNGLQTDNTEESNFNDFLKLFR